MEKSEQKFVMKFLSIESLSAKAIHRELTGVLDATALSLFQSQKVALPLRSRRPFVPRPNQASRPRHVLGKPLFDFLEKFPFANAGVIAQHFSKSRHTIKEILQHELGSRRFSRSSVPHLLSETQEADRTAMTNDLLSVIHRQAGYSFSRSVTSDEL
jgi:hypothetical protein